MYTLMPININYSFNFGVILIALLICLIISGVLSVIFYSNSLDLSFFTLIVNSLNSFNYFYLRVFHNTFANLFFLFIFFHILRSWFYTSLNNIYVIISGIIIFIVSCAVAFFGYCLPMGQMSFWAAIVIFSLLSVVPYGSYIILYLFGSFSISTRTLSLLFFLHFITPFILLVLVFLHLHSLHLNLSSNTSICDFLDLVTMLPSFLLIDFFIVFWLFLFIFIIVFFFGYFFFESANFVSFNSLVTPLHIYPDWFLLFPYACLRSIDSKLYGVFLLIIILFAVFFSPLFLAYFNFSVLINFFHTIIFFFFVLLTFIGSHPSVYPYSVVIIYLQIFLYLLYFFYFFFIFLFYNF